MNFTKNGIDYVWIRIPGNISHCPDSTAALGGKKIPELMHGLGKGVKSFKDGMNEVTNFEEEKKEEKKDE